MIIMWLMRSRLIKMMKQIMEYKAISYQVQKKEIRGVKRQEVALHVVLTMSLPVCTEGGISHLSHAIISHAIILIMWGSCYVKMIRVEIFMLKRSRQLIDKLHNNVLSIPTHSTLIVS